MGAGDYYSALNYVHSDPKSGDISVYAAMHGLGTYYMSEGMKQGVTEHIRQWFP